ncbi:hypothetical protein P3X46_018729 [Hevea brasiliensis]|uniref:Transmembrane protein n=1 Tax=Hevea brasiliensis TaxID=3981 RepID=A0ABQ9LUT6_HEVBR|nr:hypothetical protein P3X46_018729 [Hevea brasiliensis]
MGRGLKHLSFLLLVVLVLVLVLFRPSKTEARPLNIMESNRAMIWDKSFFDGLSLGAIKQSGPSPGQGNKYTDSQNFGGFHKDGPTPGQGH